jgi:hypothetical protein
MSNTIRENLNNLATSLEDVLNRPAEKPQINDRSLSGDKINGGMITNFSSVGIKDNASYTGQQVLVIDNDKVSVPALATPRITNPLTIEGTLTVVGEIHATKLHVDEISADVRNERTSPLEFKGENGGSPNGKGLIWTSKEYTKQFVLQKDRLFSSESIDVHREKDYRIGNNVVLSENELGPSVQRSNLKTVGTLAGLAVDGPVVIDQFLFWDANSQRLGVGTEAPNGAVSVGSWDHEFIIDPTDDKTFKLGTWTTGGLDIITDDTTRISIGATGSILLNDRVRVKGVFGVNVKNFAEDADITTAGPIRFQNKKFEVGDSQPTSGNYVKGDIVWNSNPQPSGYVGWICVREGTPGEWKPFGPIAS